MNIHLVALLVVQIVAVPGQEVMVTGSAVPLELEIATGALVAARTETAQVVVVLVLAGRGFAEA